MRRVVVYPGRIAVEAADIPAPAPNEALVRTLAAGVCGSDLHAAHGRHPFVPLPYRPGHEVVGVVETAGSAVEGYPPGQRVIVEPDLPCWTCKMCTSGRENLCENLQFFGCGYDQGGMADYFTLAANRLHLVPDTLDDNTAALIEPLSTPVHAVRLAGDVAGRTIAILGAGTIGLFTLAVLRAHGAGKVVSTDPNLAKRERAKALGADSTIDARTPDVAGQVEGARRQCRRRVRLRRHPVLDGPGDRHRRQGRERHGGRRPGPGGHDSAADRAGPPDPHPGQRHLPPRGLRRVGRSARPGSSQDGGLRNRHAAPRPGRRGVRAGFVGTSREGPRDRRRAVTWGPLRAVLSSALVALDFDGTLAPISPHPDDARPLAGADQILRDVRAAGATVAVVTGRSVASLLRVSSFGAIPGIVIYGTHGAERWQAGELRTPAPPPGLRELRLSLPGLCGAHDPDIWIEDKGLSLVIHTRLTAEPDRLLEMLHAPVGKLAATAGLGVRPGKEVLEICIPGIDKGTAIRELIGPG